MLKACVFCGRGFYRHQSSDPEWCRGCLDGLKRDQLRLIILIEDYMTKYSKFEAYLKERDGQAD